MKERYWRKKHTEPKPKQAKAVITSPKSGITEIRLNKFIANSGICSRRKADDLILEGEITVNGNIVKTLGAKVAHKDIVKYKNKVIVPEKFVYVLMNKPKDCITTLDDPQERKTVIHLLKNKFEQRLYPVGRLDRNTTGVLLLTNDGALTQSLSHPSKIVKKRYRVRLDKPLELEDKEKIEKGIDLEEGRIKVDRIDETPGKSSLWVDIEIHSGMNRVVRRIFESLNYVVAHLDRFYYAGLTHKGLLRGEFRELSARELMGLRRFKNKD